MKNLQGANAMNAIETYEACMEFGSEASFVANVIRNHHSHQAAKLRGLLQILKAGHSVRTAQFNIDILIIDGRKFGWEVLESPKLIETWLRTNSAEVA
jgi:hypothetical protein